MVYNMLIKNTVLNTICFEKCLWTKSNKNLRRNLEYFDILAPFLVPHKHKYDSNELQFFEAFENSKTTKIELNMR